MINFLDQYLSKKDFADLLTFGHRCLQINDILSFTAIFSELSEIIGYNNCLCAHGNMVDALTQPKPSVDCLNISYPEEYLDHYFQNGHHITDEVLLEFNKTISPVSWREVDNKHGITYPAAQLAYDFDIVDGWTYGSLDPNTSECSLFWFGGEDPGSMERSRAIVQYAVPFLSEAYKRVLDIPKAKISKLTPKELEVLRWLKEGKSSWEISNILLCSKRVIDFHAKNIITKLDATNRTDAVVKALEQGIISF
jgi:DNA-binding CsgD family transcriptional regulator